MPRPALNEMQHLSVVAAECLQSRGVVPAAATGMEVGRALWLRGAPRRGRRVKNGSKVRGARGLFAGALHRNPVREDPSGGIPRPAPGGWGRHLTAEGRTAVHPH
ncbi:hypothetical protein NDU88_011657 [Pleurodeles waltl]|uniref:Uncharacterized protein n=1 Tax=Pleurodeles waltl TaxID=8319 RepID=A0AAV7R3Q0_PLEWA|nr:hypothetical protein NDU88_011657 [Pleurodeles waltl]